MVAPNVQPKREGQQAQAYNRVSHPSRTPFKAPDPDQAGLNKADRSRALGSRATLVEPHPRGPAHATAQAMTSLAFGRRLLARK